MDRALAWNPFTKAGVAMALWDARARTDGVPLVDLFGGAIRREVPVKMSLSGNRGRLERTIAAVQALGFRAYKVKVGLGLPGDLERVRQARALVGDDFLGTDANGGWTVDDAQAALPELERLGVAFLEQPVAADDLPGMRASRGTLPVMADESVFGSRDLERVIAAEAADAVSVYVGKAGGPGRAVTLGRQAAAAGLPVVIGSNGEFGVGAAAQLHVACALEQLSPWPHDVIGSHYYADEVLESPIDNNGLRARLPEGAGLGVLPTAEVLRRFS